MSGDVWLEIVRAEDAEATWVRASRDIEAGEQVFRLPKVFADTRDRYTIEVAPGKHQAFTDDIDDFVNHSCDPNLELVTLNADQEEYVFQALVPISRGEEVTWDYETRESILEAPFPCHCGAANCRGTIVGSAARH